ncbi:hypothetical protein EK21DRAFT_117384 [Setomelanomma holmii]|uniref:Uncharacterized protein n=1 Tax=Setomelanomma holmii TaxID=210430 RepID=A0A9P4LI82_9PLEO|nr:hypothetical protein EK21DRAFT_117384 [Setomelanomma holmii]
MSQSPTTAIPKLSSSARPNVGTPSGTSIAVGGPGGNASPVGTSVASGAAMNTSSAGRADISPALSSLRPGAAVSGMIESADKQTRTTVSTDPSAATKLPSNQISSGSNGTLSLPPAAVNALQLYLPPPVPVSLNAFLSLDNMLGCPAAPKYILLADLWTNDDTKYKEDMKGLGYEYKWRHHWCIWMLAMSGSLSATRNQPSGGGIPQPSFNQEHLQR